METERENPNIQSRCAMLSSVASVGVVAVGRLVSASWRSISVAGESCMGSRKTTVHVSYMALDRETAKEEHRSLVGRGITNTRVYVLDGGLAGAL